MLQSCLLSDIETWQHTNKFYMTGQNEKNKIETRYINLKI